MESLEKRILALEQSNVALRRRVQLLAAAMVLGVAIPLVGYAVATEGTSRFESITTKELSVVDEKGVVRDRLGGNVPDGVMYGGRVSKRGAKAAGLMIYDEDGIERGGYFTSVPGSNAMLTLDSKYRQAALFVAGPDESQVSALQVWTKDSAIELRSDFNGSRISASTNNQVTWQMPSISLGAESCAVQRGLEEKYPGKNVCRERFTEGACRVCLTK